MMVVDPKLVPINPIIPVKFYGENHSGWVVCLALLLANMALAIIIVHITRRKKAPM